MSIVQPTLTNDQITIISNYINTYRAVHQAPPLIWDSTITSFSQGWSYNLVSKNLFQHSGNPSYGENLAYYQGYGSDVMTLLKKAVDDWYNEYTQYDYNNPVFSGATGHFTCLVWKSSTNFGMGISINTVTDSVDVVMNTSPPGNYEGEFAANVLPSVSIVIPLPQLPVPTPTPMPMPIPTPMPTPTPTPTPIYPNIYDYITSIYNITYAVQMKQPRPLIVNALYKVINNLNHYKQIDINAKRQIYNILSTITIAVQQNESKNYVLQNLQNVIHIFNQCIHP